MVTSAWRLGIQLTAKSQLIRANPRLTIWKPSILLECVFEIGLYALIYTSNTWYFFSIIPFSISCLIAYLTIEQLENHLCLRYFRILCDRIQRFLDNLLWQRLSGFTVISDKFNSLLHNQKHTIKILLDVRVVLLIYIYPSFCLFDR